MQKGSIKIGVFGHYGNRNLGDEAIIEAVIQNLRHHIPDCDIVCLSINPHDSRERHGVEAFPIRYRKDFFKPAREPTSTRQNSSSISKSHSTPNNTGLKATLKRIPGLKLGVKTLGRILDGWHGLKQEVGFLKSGRRYLDDMDLLLITGSNQFLDNFGGAWGFPYTLMKWTLLARMANTKVAYVSIGAGPLERRLSFWMLRVALKRADYVSYRDEGSKRLIESRISIDAPVYPDLAHALRYPSPGHQPKLEEGAFHVAVNPMPVFDRRYWYQADDQKFSAYVGKLTDLCRHVLKKGHHLTLFSTQAKDELLVDEMHQTLVSDPEIAPYMDRVSCAKSQQVGELMRVIDGADLIVATRFHATVLPLQLNKPVLGVCYYRKAAELLDDIGLGDFHVDINDFSTNELVEKFQLLTERCLNDGLSLSYHNERYQALLEEQYRKIADLAELSIQGQVHALNQ
ncbi:exopolysaccharide biosynthesis protein [Saccharospirillum salsuginis]|uniref:Exopolysaccharide biosynthesis protein n=2 Tax=Saccharospirillum salsuginis TaxID=418750 RepID=A0A918N976_9GAMM|nr:exopolysaccharide biosynthesis protein [Saccharospirillum salsuginis]